jgi:hypothetical protein
MFPPLGLKKNYNDFWPEIKGPKKSPSISSLWVIDGILRPWQHQHNMKSYRRV